MWRWVLSAFLGINSAVAAPDWSRVPAKEIPMFFPGPTGLEWVMTKTDHTGSRKIKEQNQTCFDCHENDADKIGDDIVAGKKVGKANLVIDHEVPKGKRGSFPLNIQATHDDQKLYLRLEWESGPPDEQTPADPKNEMKLTVMFGNDQVEGARLNGCWASCHMDLRTMPDAAARARKHPGAKAFGWSDGVTKYIGESRRRIEMDKSPRGGWDKLRPGKELAAALKTGKFLDLMQFRSGAGEKPVDGYVLESRHMGGGKSLIDATGTRQGNKWTVTFERLLKGAGVGDHTILPGQPVTFGVAVHENHSGARFHHVSLGYTLGLDDPAAFVNAVRLPEPGAPQASANAPNAPSAPNPTNPTNPTNTAPAVPALAQPADGTNQSK